MKYVALICARGGSKGLPGKNIKPLKSSSSDVMKFILSGGISGKIEV